MTVEEVVLDAYPYFGTSPLTVTFTVTWVGGTPPYEVRVDFKDGWSESIGPLYSYSYTTTHTYETPGTYYPVATVTDSTGEPKSDEFDPGITVSGPKVKLTVTVFEGGDVYVVDRGWVRSGETKTFEIDQGSTVTLEAHPKEGYEFDHWYRSPPGWREYANPLTITIDYDTEFYAYFKERPTYHTVKIRVASGRGQICADSTCTTSSDWWSMNVRDGEPITIKAVEAYYGWEFDYMLINGVKYTRKEVSLTVDQDISAEAYFKEKEAPPPPLTAYLDAYPLTGYAPLTVTFNASWSGGTPPYTVEIDYDDGNRDSKSTSGYSATFTHTYSEAKTYEAKIIVTDSSSPPQKAEAKRTITVKERPQQVTLTIKGAEGGTIYYMTDEIRAGDVKTYKLNVGDSVVIRQAADPGYGFVAWIVNGNTMQADILEFRITDNTTVTASFEKLGECTEGETKCIGTDLYECRNGQWVLVEKDSPKCKKPPIDWTKILPIALIAILGIAIVEELTE